MCGVCVVCVCDVCVVCVVCGVVCVSVRARSCVCVCRSVSTLWPVFSPVKLAHS